MLVGTNSWYTNPSTQVWNLTAQCGVQTIRIGGAEYDRNMPSKTTLASWVSKIQAMGAEPVIQVSQEGTPEAAAALVSYFNIDSATGKPVKFWNIGNEPWLQNGQPSTSTVGALIETYFKPISMAMKEADSTIKIYGPDVCYYMDVAINDLFGGKNDIAGKIPGKSYYYCDGITWHSYPQDGSINLAYQGIDQFKSSIIKCKTKVDQVNADKNRTGDDALGWGIGEFNAKDGSLVHTWENGQMFGGILDLCMKYEATYATSWSMFENGGSRQGTDFSFIDGANMTPRATYRHMEMVAKYFRGSYSEGTSTNNDIIVFGSRQGDTITAMIMNRANTSTFYTLHLNKDSLTETGVNLTVDADSSLMHQDLIMGRSTQLLFFQTDSIFKLDYSSSDFDNEIPPHASWVTEVALPPGAPLSLECSASTFNTMDLTWDLVTSDTISGIIIERKMDGEANFQEVGIVGNSDTVYTDQNLEALTLYKYRIQSYNSAGFSEYSNEAEGSTLDLPAPRAFNGPHTIPGRIEAEDFNDNPEGIGYHDSDPANKGGEYRTTEGVDMEICTDEGGGYNVGYIEAGEWLEYLVDSIEGNTYNIALRTASNVAGSKQIRLYLDDILLGQVYANYTGGWQNWETVVIEGVEISEGTDQILKILFDGADCNINWIEFEVDLTGVPGNQLMPPINGFYHSPSKSLLVNSNSELNNVSLTLFDILGKVHFKMTEQQILSNQYPIDVPNGIYLLN
ncbi:MAG: carbohydrate-binding protein, partial [Spirochaetales bacterium]|nr:carbohydrate-binding protein [Spirochaetales bacterium]